ncbi:MAG: aspartyl protease family protein [Acidobacteriota bacterium]|nr:aspartyl protease family protein [Acidobacteriota bacterium]
MAVGCLLLVGCAGPNESPAEDPEVAPATRTELAWPQPEVELEALDPSDIPPVSRSSPPEGLQAALQQLDFGFVDRHEVEGPPRQLSELFEAVFSRGREEALSAAAELSQRQDLDALAGLAGAVHQNLLMDAGRYGELAALLAEDEVPPFVAGLAALPPQRVSFVDEPFSTAIEPSPAGPAMVATGVAGHRLNLLVDTGASFSVLSESVAHRVGVELGSAPGFDVETSVDAPVRARIASLGLLRFGRAEVRDHPVLVMSDEALRFPLPDGSQWSLDGIVGWNILRQGRLVLDWKRGVYDFSPSRGGSDAEPNLFWLGYPLVTCRTADGEPLLFGLDTGSRNTSLEASALDKLSFGEVRKKTVTIGGAGGTQEVETEVVDWLELIIHHTRVAVADVQREDHGDAFFVTMDGTLGVDFTQQARMVVDFPRGEFRVEP